MKRNEIIDTFQNLLKSFGTVITEDLEKKFEVRPCLYLAVLRSFIGENVEKNTLSYIVEIVYIPAVSGTSELYDEADALASVVLSASLPEAYIRDFEVIADVLGNKSIFCNFELVCFTN